MGSWVQCICGERLNKNLFSGNQWSVLVPEESLEKDHLIDSDINSIIVKSKIVKTCPSCDCLIVLDDQSNRVKFFKEQSE